MLPHGVTRHLGNLQRGTANGSAQRVLTHELLHKVFESNVGRVVLVHGDLFEDHTAFLLKVSRIQQGVGDHIGDDVHRHGRVIVEHTRVVAGVFLSGQRIGFTAYRIEG